VVGTVKWQALTERFSEQNLRKVVAAYLGLVSQVDQRVGLILQEVQKQGALENTIIVYSADHGDYAGEHGLYEKRGGISTRAITRIPLIVRYPRKVPRGRVCEEIVESLNIFPTFCELAGIEIPDAHAHHDAEWLANGNTLVVCNGPAHYGDLCPAPVLYDYIQEIAPDGQVVWEWRYAAHSQELSHLGPAIPPVPRGDWPHLNTVESLPDTPLGRRDPRFRKGSVLFSARHAHTIGVVDKEDGAIVWAWGPGQILGQHQPPC